MKFLCLEMSYQIKQNEGKEFGIQRKIYSSIQPKSSTFVAIDRRLCLSDLSKKG